MNERTFTRTAAVALAIAALLGSWASPALAVITPAVATDVPGTPMTAPFTVRGSLVPSPAQWEDVYAVPLTAGQTLDVTLTVSTALQAYLGLYAPGTPTVKAQYDPRYLLASDLSAVDQTGTFSYTAPNSDTYYIDVAGVVGKSGTYVLSADIEGLVQVPTSITIAASPAKVRYPTPFVLSGALTPGVFHDPCGVEVKKPGSARWSYSSARLAYATSGTSALWWYRYTPTLRGIYNFRVRYVTTPDRLGSVSRVIAVTVTR